MSEKEHEGDKNTVREPEVIDGQTGMPEATPQQVKLLGRTLSSLRDVRIAIAKIIRAEVQGEVEHNRAKGLVWMLRELGGVIEQEQFEERLERLEERAGLSTQRISSPMRRLN